MQQSYVVILFAFATTASSTLAAYFLKTAVGVEHEIQFSYDGLKNFALYVLFKIELYVAILCYIIALMLSALTLSTAPLGVFIPILFALNTFSIIIVGITFFGEPISTSKVIGICLLISGIFLVARH